MRREDLQKTLFDPSDDKTSGDSHTQPFAHSPLAPPCDETLESQSLDNTGQGPDGGETVPHTHRRRARPIPPRRSARANPSSGITSTPLSLGSPRARLRRAPDDRRRLYCRHRGQLALRRCGRVPASQDRLVDRAISGGSHFSLRWLNLSLLFAWGVAAACFQASLRRKARLESVVRAWIGTDVLLATILLIIDGQPMTPLTLVYGLLIVASGLWSRTRVVVFATALAMIGYTVLIAEGWAYGKPIGFRYGNLDFLVGLALMGFMTAYQARRASVRSEH